MFSRLPVPRDADGLEVVDPLAPPDAGQHLVLLGAAVVGDDEGDVPAHRLRGGPAEDALGPGVPGGDDAVERLADDRVVRGVDDGGEARLGDLASALRGDVPGDLGGAHDPARVILDR